jgi:S1-C subfamily serine protease
VVGNNRGVAGVGLALAVPINAGPRRISGALMCAGGYRRAYLGFAGGTRPLPPRLARELGRRAGVEVVEVAPGSPASAAGLRPEDLIVAVDGDAVERVDDVQRLMVGDRIGADVRLEVLRGDRTVELRLVPVELSL